MTYRKTTYNPINTSENLACSFFSYEEKSCTEAYRFGFNGMESEDDLYGEKNAYDFGARIYDARLGRWLSIDPLLKKYPYHSPYIGNDNNPILLIDIDGKDAIISISDNTITFTSVIYITGYKANATKAQEIQSSIMDTWGGTFKYTHSDGKEYDVKFDVQVKVAPTDKLHASRLSAGENLITILNLPENSASSVDNTPGNPDARRTGTWAYNPRSEKTYAHEYSHLLGIVDLYYRENGVYYSYTGVEEFDLQGVNMHNENSFVTQRTIDVLAEYALNNVNPELTIETPQWTLDRPRPIEMQPMLKETGNTLPTEFKAKNVNLRQEDQIK